MELPRTLFIISQLSLNEGRCVCCTFSLYIYNITCISLFMHWPPFTCNVKGGIKEKSCYRGDVKWLSRFITYRVSRHVTNQHKYVTNSSSHFLMRSQFNVYIVGTEKSPPHQQCRKLNTSLFYICHWYS